MPTIIPRPTRVKTKMVLLNVTPTPPAVTTGLLVIAVGLLSVAAVPDRRPVPMLSGLAAVADSGAADSFGLDADAAGACAVCVGGTEGASSAGLVVGTGHPGVVSVDPVAATGQTVV